MRRAWVTAILAWAIALGAGLSPAQAAGVQLAKAPTDSGVNKLWKQYPLDDGRDLPPAKGGVSTDSDGSVTPQPGKSGGQRSTSASATPTPQAKRPASQDQASPNGGSGGGGGLKAGWIIAVVGFLVVVDIVIFVRVRQARRRRRRDSAQPVWGQSSNVYAVGFTDRDAIGAFRGFVHAMGSATGPGVDRMLLVHDPAREQPVWVRRSEVATLSTGGAGAGAGGAVAATAARKPVSKPEATAPAP